MKTTIFSSLVMVLASLSATALAAECIQDIENSEPFTMRWRIHASGVPDIPGICGGFWDNLNNKNFNGACLVSHSSCDGQDGNMDILFRVPLGCNGGHVESAWWEATKNDFGGIDCP